MESKNAAVAVFLSEHQLKKESTAFLKSLRNMTKNLVKNLEELENVASEGVFPFVAGARFDRLTEGVSASRDEILSSMGMRRIEEQGASGNMISRIEFKRPEESYQDEAA